MRLTGWLMCLSLYVAAAKTDPWSLGGYLLGLVLFGLAWALIALGEDDA